MDKAPGLLTMGTDRDKVNTAYYRLTDYVRKGNPKSRERVFIVHRLDRDVSGILVFARSPAAKIALQSRWENVEKRYLALVHGVPPEPEGTFQSYLVESGVHRVYSSPDPKQGKLSRTGYKLLGQARGVSLLEIDLFTGRKHQIRVHLAENNLPIVGDRKYGRKQPGERRLALHAKSLAFEHPYTGEPCFFETRMPHLFARVPIGVGIDTPPAYRWRWTHSRSMNRDDWVSLDSCGDFPSGIAVVRRPLEGVGLGDRPRHFLPSVRSLDDLAHSTMERPAGFYDTFWEPTPEPPRPETRAPDPAPSKECPPCP